MLNMNKLKLVDLFAGTGAFSKVFSKFGVECVYANDFCKESEVIYNLNHTNELINKNINDVKPLEIPNHDILCAGFPCQPFSIAGKRDGFNDERSNVFWSLLEIIKFHTPKILILENVKNLVSHDKGKTFNTIKKHLIDAGYHIKYHVLNTSKYTKVPQNRERIYILCFRSKKLFNKFDFDFPEKTNSEIIDFLENKVDTKYYYSDRFKIYKTIEEELTSNIETGVLYQWRRYYLRENKSGVCPTLTANMGTGGHNVPLLMDDVGIRKLTPKECFNLQGFRSSYKLPTNLSDCRLYKLAGNAVSPPIVKLIAKKLSTII